MGFEQNILHLTKWGIEAIAKNKIIFGETVFLILKNYGHA